MTIAVVADNVRVVTKHYVSIRMLANGALTAGDVVYHDGTGMVVADDDASQASATCWGIALQDVASGKQVDVLILGELTGWTGLTAGGIAFVTDDGKVSASVGTNNYAVGFMTSTTNILVAPHSPAIAA